VIPWLSVWRPEFVRPRNAKEIVFLSKLMTPLAVHATRIGIARLCDALGTLGAGVNGVDMCGGLA
jgi:hypothetical protein